MCFGATRDHVSTPLSIWIYHSYIFFKLAQNLFPCLDEYFLNPFSMASATAESHLSPEPFSTRINADWHLGSSEEPTTGFGSKQSSFLILCCDNRVSGLFFCQIDVWMKQNQISENQTLWYKDLHQLLGLFQELISESNFPLSAYWETSKTLHNNFNNFGSIKELQ